MTEQTAVKPDCCEGSKAVNKEGRTAERLKRTLLGELHLMRPADLEAYWKQVKWPKPDLVKLAKSQSSPLAHALRRLRPELLAQASKQPDPFGWLLEAVEVSKWSDYCQQGNWPWATRIWLATASQLRAEHRLIHKAHGWADTWEELRRNKDKPDRLQFADEFFFAQLRHANPQRKAELLATPGLDERIAIARREKDQVWLRRFGRNKKDLGAPYPVTASGKYMVQHWLELSRGLPGLSFFSDHALDCLLDAFGLKTGEDWATKQMRVRLGLIQAGAKRHLIEEVIAYGGTLKFTGRILEKPWTFNQGVITWGKRRLWPRSG